MGVADFDIKHLLVGGKLLHFGIECLLRGEQCSYTVTEGHQPYIEAKMAFSTQYPYQNYDRKRTDKSMALDLFSHLFLLSTCTFHLLHLLWLL